MKIIPSFLVPAVVLLSACTNQATGQKGGELQTAMDSVSYGIGVDIGHNVKGNLAQAKLDSINVDLLFKGLRDGYDSTQTVPAEVLREVIQTHMMKAQQKQMDEERKAGEANRVVGEKFLLENGKRKEVVTTASGLQYEVVKAGKGPKPAATDRVRVHYRGTLVDGSEFDSSFKRGEPIEFSLNGVIPGWTEGVQLMPVGSTYKLYIPSELGYGAQSMGPQLPAHSTLIFDVELLDILK